MNLQNKTLQAAASILIYFVILGAACTPKTDPHRSQRNLFVKQYARYMADNNTILGEITVGMGDSIHKAIVVEAPGKVLFEKKPMRKATFGEYGVQYSAEKKVAGPNKSFTFELEDLAGNMQPTQTPHLTVEDFNVGQKGIVNKTNGSTWSYQGEPLRKGEDMLLFFAIDTSDWVVTRRGPDTKTEFELPEPVLKNAPEGKGEVYLIRRYKGVDEAMQTDSGTVQIRWEVEHFTKSQVVEIIK